MRRIVSVFDLLSSEIYRNAPLEVRATTILQNYVHVEARKEDAIV